jgi:hypothetical protein
VMAEGRQGKGTSIARVLLAANSNSKKVELSYPRNRSWRSIGLRIPHCRDNQLADGSKTVSSTNRPRFTPQKHYYFSVSGINFC